MGNIMAQDATGRSKRDHSACMGYEDNDDDNDEYYLMAGEDEDEDEDEDEKEYYRKKIMELYEEKMKKFAHEDALAEQINCKESKKSSKRPTKKIKMQQRKPTPIVSNQVPQQLKQFITNDMNEVERKKWKSTPAVEKNKKVEIVRNKITQELEEFITNKMKGKEAQVVIQKTLYRSDLKENQNRLSMPMKQLIKPDDQFLRKNEKEDLENGMEMEVGLLGPTLKMHEKPMVLKMWHMNSTSNYVLKTNWNNFVKANEKDLKKKENTKIQVWSFRRDEKLCFAIACLERDVDGQNDATIAPVI